MITQTLAYFLITISGAHAGNTSSTDASVNINCDHVPNVPGAQCPQKNGTTIPLTAITTSPSLDSKIPSTKTGEK